MRLYENEYVELSIDERVPCLEWKGKRYMSSEAFRESEEKSLQFYRKYKDRYPQLQWFVDAREIGPVSVTDQDWVVKDILPGFASSGLKKEGFVVPKSSVGKLVVKNYSSKAGETIMIKVFASESSAKQWLME